MSKELEALNKIQHDFGQLKGQELVSCYETIFNALKRLEAIDNSNPSEAMKALKEISNLDVVVGKTKKYDISTPLGNYLKCEITTIKQALLKAQEPKHYLKWEDLEFNIDKQMMTVLLNGTKYTLIVGRNVHIDKLAFLRNGEINCYFLEADKQFFNDLHLERVEE